MTGRQRVEAVLRGDSVDHPPIVPIVHSALARVAGVPLGRYFSEASVMADVVAQGCTRFGFDGVQLTLGVSAEPEALGARVEQPPDAAPLLKQNLLADESLLEALRSRDLVSGGRLPMYHEAVREVVRRIGGKAFVISTLRGPLNMASQLRGVEDMLIDMLRRRELAESVLDFTTEAAIRVARASLEAGAHGLMFGEATCSPNFIAPRMYRGLVQPRHVRLIRACHEMGWTCVGLHICGNILPIMEDLVGTGADLIDVDYQVPVRDAITAVSGRVCLRGNLNPVKLFLQGTPEQVRAETAAVVREAAGARWMISSGCDIPPGTPEANLSALVTRTGT